MYWLYLVFSIAAYLGGDYFSKLYADHNTSISMLELISCYGLSIVFWVLALKIEGQLASSGAIWSMASVVGTVLMGLLLFQEKLSPVNVAGLGLAVVAMFLIYR